MKRKKLLICLLCLILAVTFVCSGIAVDESNNQTGTDAGLGKAEPGNAQVWSSSIQQKTAIWKISVYVAGNDGVEHRPSETLTDDYIQFGSTFWLYRKTGDYSADFKDTNFFATLNKEEYLRGSDKTFRKGTYKSLSYRIYAGEENGFPGTNDYNRVPYVPNCGKVSGMTSEQISLAMTRFFNDNGNTSNNLINLAAKAAGFKDYKELLLKILDEGKIIVNGRTAGTSQLSMVDPYRKETSQGVFEAESSSVAWVILYEPALRFAESSSSDANRYYVSASDVAKLMCDAILNFAGTTANTMRYRFSPSYVKAHNIYAKDENNIVIDGKTTAVVSKNCTTPYFVNLANSVYLSDNWLGYSAPKISNPRKETDDLWLVTQTVYGWYADTMLERAGFGLRYQKSDVQTVEFTKKVNTDGEHLPDYSKIVIVVTNTETGVTYNVQLDENGVGHVNLPLGNYSVTEYEGIGYVKNGMSSEDLVLTQSGEAYSFQIARKSERKLGITVENTLVFHSVKINYRDKYTGEVIYSEHL